MVADRDELPVLAKDGRGRERLGDPHLRGLVDDHEVEVLLGPVDRAPAPGAVLEQVVEPARRAADDQQSLAQQHRPLLVGAEVVGPARHQPPDPLGHRVGLGVADLHELQVSQRLQPRVVRREVEQLSRASGDRFERDVRGRVRPREHRRAERPRLGRERERADEYREPERVALAGPGRPLHDEDAVRDVPADDVELRVGEAVRRLRPRGEVGERRGVSNPFRPDRPWRFPLLGALDPPVEVVRRGVSDRFEELVGVQVVGHLVERVERARVGREQPVAVPKERALEAHRHESKVDAARVDPLDDREPAVDEPPSGERLAVFDQRVQHAPIALAKPERSGQLRGSARRVTEREPRAAVARRLALEQRRAAGLGAKLGRKRVAKRQLLSPRVMLQQQEVFERAVERNLVRLDLDAVEPVELQGRLVDLPILEGELSLDVPERATAQRAERGEVVERRAVKRGAALGLVEPTPRGVCVFERHLHAEPCRRLDPHRRLASLGDRAKAAGLRVALVGAAVVEDAGAERRPRRQRVVLPPEAHRLGDLVEVLADWAEVLSLADLIGEERDHAL